MQATLLMLSAVAVAVALGMIARSDSPDSSAAHEIILSKAKIPPKLPRYTPGGGWPKWPVHRTAPAGFTVSSEAAEEAESYEPPYVPEEAEPIYVPPPTEESSSGGRPHGITIR